MSDVSPRTAPHLPPWSPDRPNRAANLPRVIGHRGAAAHAPENTLPGIEAAARLGAAWVEFDVKLSRDGVPVLFHDATLRRTAGLPGRVADTPFEALRRPDVGRAFGVEATIPSFEEAIALLGRLGLGANVEIKPCAGREAETARTVSDVLRTSWPANLPPPLVSSFAPAALAAAREAAPALPLGLLAGAVPRGWRRLMTELGCATLHLDHRRVSRAEIDRLKAEGVPLLLYTVNEPVWGRGLLDAGVDGLISDRPGDLLAALA